MKSKPIGGSMTLEEMEKEKVEGEKLHGKIYGPDEEGKTPESTEQIPQPKEPAVSAEVIKPEVSEQPPSKPDEKKPPVEEPVEVKDLKHKYDTLFGKYNTEMARNKAENEELLKETSELTDSIIELQKQVTTMKQQKEQVTPPEPAQAGSMAVTPKKYLTQEEIDNVGPENIAAIRSGAREVAEQVVADFGKEVEKKLNEYEQKLSVVASQGETLKGRQALSENDVFIQKLTRLCPEWQKYYNDNKFVEWLGGSIPLTKLTRKEVLDFAYKELDAEGVADVCNGYINSIAPAIPENEIVQNAPETPEITQPAPLQNQQVVVEPVTQNIPESLIAPSLSKAGDIHLPPGDKPERHTSERVVAAEKYQRNEITYAEYIKTTKELDEAYREGRLIQN